MKFELAKEKIRLISDDIDSIREHFSIKDETARFRMRGRARWAAPSRLYCITPTGLFEPGLFFDIFSYIKQEYPNKDCEIDQDILKEYHDSLEQLETSVYPDIRKKYLKMSHKNLIDIMKQEQKYFNSIGRVNDNEKIEDDVSTISDKDKQQRFSLDRITNPLSSNIRKSFELNDIENGNNSPDIDLNKIDIKFRETIEPLSKNELSPLDISLN